jgi:hypothetical protein
MLVLRLKYRHTIGVTVNEHLLMKARESDLSGYLWEGLSDLVAEKEKCGEKDNDDNAGNTHDRL